MEQSVWRELGSGLWCLFRVFPVHPGITSVLAPSTSSYSFLLRVHVLHCPVTSARTGLYLFLASGAELDKYSEPRKCVLNDPVI